MIQFLLGGLFSAYVVFYFQSASFTKTAVFFALLLFLLVINEFLEKKYTNLYLQTSLFIFFSPRVVRIYRARYIPCGSLISLTTAEGLIFLLKRQSVFTDEKTFRKTAGIPIVLTALLIFFTRQTGFTRYCSHLNSGEYTMLSKKQWMTPEHLTH